jgi:DNA-binding NarL/FixJ family response regulator
MSSGELTFNFDNLLQRLRQMSGKEQMMTIIGLRLDGYSNEDIALLLNTQWGVVNESIQNVIIKLAQ